MKKLLLTLGLVCALPVLTMAQTDDLYFSTSKVTKRSSVDDTPTYYAGSNRNVDEYNRRGKFRSYYQKIGSDSLGNDIITFRAGNGVYPDSSYIDTAYVYPGSARFDEDDYSYTRRMSRWDGFYDPWFYGYYGPWRYGWYDPWYYGYWGWADPWYYGYYGGWYGYGWYNPWYYGYYGWGWGVPRIYVRDYAYNYGGNPRGLTGNRTWTGPRSTRTVTGGTFTGPDGGTYTSRSARNRAFGSRSTTGSMTGSRSYSPSQSSTRSFGSGTFSGGNSGSFGSSRPAGGTFGGSHSGVSPSGGRFGGGRR